jgi:hypothetical protein
MTDMVKELDEGQKKVLRKIEALLRVADKGKDSEDAHTANEAASAAAKAQELLVAYNLDASLLGGSDDKGSREQQKLRGGFYQYQRDLWHEVAELNFCLHFMSGGYKRWEVKKRNPDGTFRMEKRSKWEKRHRLIGRSVNVLATVNMGTYLQEAIERLVTEQLKEKGLDNAARWSAWNVAFREGAAETIIYKLSQRRREMLREEERKEREAREAAVRAAGADVSTSTALSLASVVQSERDLNRDHLYGLEPGTTAAQRAQRAAEMAAEAEARRRAEEEYTRWAAENPEEARAQEEAAREERRKQAEKDRKREEYNASRRTGGGRYWGSETSAERRQNSSAFYMGREAAEKIGLDPQMGRGSERKLTHG